MGLLFSSGVFASYMHLKYLNGVDSAVTCRVSCPNFHAGPQLRPRTLTDRELCGAGSAALGLTAGTVDIL